MSKFQVDYSKLENKVNKRAYRLSDVKDRIEVVAFDVVRFKDSDKGADLWQIQSAEDGEYIVALYQAEELEKEAGQNWNVVVNKTAGDLQVSYKGDPIIKIASAKLGIPRSELHKVEEYLPYKLAESKKLVKALLNELNESAKTAVFNKYPELV